MKKEEASYHTTSTLLAIARTHFTKYGYFEVSLEKIAEEGNVTRGQSIIMSRTSKEFLQQCRNVFKKIFPYR